MNAVFRLAEICNVLFWCAQTVFSRVIVPSVDILLSHKKLEKLILVEVLPGECEYLQQDS